MDEDLQSFDRATISTILLAVLFPFLLGKAFGFEPPWPDEPGYIAGFMNALVAFICFSNVARSQKALRKKQKIAVTLCLVLIVAYLAVTGLFVYEEPTTGSKIVSGFQCTDVALQIKNAGGFFEECPFVGSAVLESTGYRPELIWTAFSIRTVQIFLISIWVIFFLSVTYGCAVSYAFVRHREKRRHNK